MALVTCSECKSEISDTATSCPKCGYTAPKPGWPWGWIIGAPVGLFALVMIVGTVGANKAGYQDQINADARRECSKALMSSLGTSTSGYQDKQAYEAVVREKCAGMSINGKPVIE